MAVGSLNEKPCVSPPRRLQLPLLERRAAGADYVRLLLDAPPDWRSLPGQFLNLLCESDPQAVAASERRPLEYEEGGDWPLATGLELGRRRWPLVRRPLSVSRVRRAPGRVRLELLVRAIGSGTRFLASRPVGAPIDAVGPLGNHFALPEEGRLALLVGGGCGMAPIFGLADWLADEARPCTLILGAPTLAEMPLRFRDPPPATGDRAEPCRTVAEPDTSVETVLATDDGSAGFRGTAIAALDRLLKDLGERPVALYGCGPERMLRALARLAERRGLPCQVSLETFMGCGIGVCLSCAAKTRDPSAPQGWTYRLTCRDGPVVEARDVLWGT